MSVEKPILAADLGGSKIVTAVVSPQGEVVAREYVATLAEEGPQAVIRRMLAAFASSMSRASIGRSSLSRVVVACAGPIDTNRGIVTASPNLPGWTDIPLREILEKEMGLEVLLVNDATAATLGEHRFGAGRGVNNLIYLTVSTGIGGGIIIGGKLYSGSSGSAGEIGHMTVDMRGARCSCGNIGCLELLASGKAMSRMAQSRIAEGAKSLLLKLVEGEPHNISAQTIAVAARRGDALSLEVISEAATYLGIGLVNLVNIFNPDMIVVGGGVARMGDLLLNPARKVVEERAFHLPAQAAKIVISQLGDNVALLGGLALVLDISSDSPAT